MEVTSRETSPIEVALYGICGEPNVCLGVFHQSAANIRVIQHDQHGPQANDKSGRMLQLHLVERQNCRIVEAETYK